MGGKFKNAIQNHKNSINASNTVCAISAFTNCKKLKTNALSCKTQRFYYDNNRNKKLKLSINKPFVYSKASYRHLKKHLNKFLHKSKQQNTALKNVFLINNRQFQNRHKKQAVFFIRKNYSRLKTNKIQKLMSFQWYEVKKIKQYIFNILDAIQLEKKTETLLNKKWLYFDLKQFESKLLATNIKVILGGLQDKIKDFLKQKKSTPKKLTIYRRFSSVLKIRKNKKFTAGAFNKLINAKHTQVDHMILINQTKKFLKTVKNHKGLKKLKIKKIFFSKFISRKNYKNIWRKLFFKKSFDNHTHIKSAANAVVWSNHWRRKKNYQYSKFTRKLIKLFSRRNLDIPYFLKKRKKKKKFVKPKLWSNFFSQRDYLNIIDYNRSDKKLYLPLSNAWVFSKKCKGKVEWNGYVTTSFFPKSISIITSMWRPQCKSLFKLINLSKIKTNSSKKFVKTQIQFRNLRIANAHLNYNLFKKKAWNVENLVGCKKIIFTHKRFLIKKKINVINWLKLRRAHRFGNFSWNKKTYFVHFTRYLRWRCKVEPYKREILNSYVPFKFQHTQKNPYRYYKLARWDHKANRWLTPIAHLRKLSWWQLHTQITLEKRHPHRYKSYKIYLWFTRTLANRWNYGMRAKKFYRLKQIMFGRIILPALDYLGKKQFLHIKKNVSTVKPLGLQHSRPAMFLGKFERRIDILTYKLNFAPTIQWARSFVSSGLVYVSYLTFLRTINYKQVLLKKQKFPLYMDWKVKTIPFFNPEIANKWRKPLSAVGRWQWNMPSAITLPSYLVRVKGIIHWSSKNITTLFYRHFCKRYMPRYFIYNRSQTTAYFWRNLRLSDIDRQRSATRIKWNTMKWVM